MLGGEVAFRPQKVYNRSDISDRFKSLEMQGKRRYKSTEPSWINRQSFSDTDTDTDTELHLRQSAFPTGDSSKKSNPQMLVSARFLSVGVGNSFAMFTLPLLR